MRIKFSDVIENTLSHKDTLQFIESITGNCALDGMDHVHVAFSTETPDEGGHPMTYIRVYFQAFKARETGSGTHYRLHVYRANNFSCSNIELEKINETDFREVGKFVAASRKQ